MCRVLHSMWKSLLWLKPPKFHLQTCLVWWGNFYFPCPLSIRAPCFINVTSLPGTQFCCHWEPDASATSMLAKTFWFFFTLLFSISQFWQMLLFGGTSAMSQCLTSKEGWEFEFCLLGMSPNTERFVGRHGQLWLCQIPISPDLAMLRFAAVITGLGAGKCLFQRWQCWNSRPFATFLFLPAIVLFLCHPCSQHMLKYLIHRSVWKLHTNRCELECVGHWCSHITVSSVLEYKRMAE